MLKNIQSKVGEGLQFSKKEIGELLRTIRQVKKGEGVAGPFKNSKMVLDYLHNEGSHRQ
ncbi:MAG: hypothetical protein AAB391_02780 [Patescibacteria group bacterium]